MCKTRYENIIENMTHRELAILLIEKDFDNHMIYKCPDGRYFDIRLVEDEDEYERAIEHTITWLKEIERNRQNIFFRNLKRKE